MIHVVLVSRASPSTAPATAAPGHVLLFNHRPKVILKRKRDDAVVLFGIVRVTRALLAPEIRDAIEGEQIPLGRILIRSEVLRRVRLLSLWRVEPGEDLCRIFALKQPQTCYGRTALMYCDTVPVIELLEVVTVA